MTNLNTNDAKGLLDQFQKDAHIAYDSFTKYMVNDFQLDDLGTGLFQRSLEKIENYVILQEYAPTDIESYVTHLYGLDWGAEKITYTTETAFGKARESLLTDDIPFADVSRAEEGNLIQTIAFGYKYTQEELEASAFALRNRSTTLGDSLIVSKQRAALQGLRELNHFKGCYGDSARGIYGLFNNPYVDVYDETVLTPVGTITLAQMRDWFLTLVKGLVQASKLTDKPNTILMSLDLATKMTSLRSSTASDRTAFDLVKEDLAPYGVTNFKVINEVGKADLEANSYGTTNKDLMVIYKDSSDVVERQLSSVMAMPLERSLNNYQAFFRQRISSVYFKRPYKALYVTYPNTL